MGSRKKRANWHDYSRPGLYMVTLETRFRESLLGMLVAGPEPRVLFSPLGLQIRNSEFPKISALYPNVEVWRLCLMPDHIHILLHVREPFADARNLGHVIRGFKSGCTQAFRRMLAGGDMRSQFQQASDASLFEPGYNDRVILSKMHARTWIRYLDDNPRRALLKRDNPDLFTVIYDFEVAGMDCQIVGNRFLLEIPDKMAVIVHNSDSGADFERKKREWLGRAERGAVLVSAAISDREKTVMHEAMEAGFPLIFLRRNGFLPNYKPSGRSFDACASGRLLQVSPWKHSEAPAAITRDQCLYLNALAEIICGNAAYSLPSRLPD